jgi:pre-rRNA-processing protein IPI3
MSLTTVGVLQPLRSLSNHRAAITSLAAGKSSSNTNICISGSKDNTCVIWDYQSGDLLRTLLLPVTPLCLALDPCDRVVYVGFEDTTIQAIELFKPSAAVNSLYDDDLRSTPIQIAHEPLSGAPADIGVPDCLDLSYDGMTLLSGHQSGKVIQWDAGAKKFATELADLNAPVNNLKILSPFEDKRRVRVVNVVKPRLGESSHTFTGQFTSTLESDSFQDKVCSPGFFTEMLESAIMEFSSPATSVAADAQLRKENEELWKVVNEQRQLQKRTFDKYREAVS